MRISSRPTDHNGESDGSPNDVAKRGARKQSPEREGKKDALQHVAGRHHKVDAGAKAVRQRTGPASCSIYPFTTASSDWMYPLTYR
jgi:hypothetical protein